jgi:pre-mRNA-splicing factor ATP-dependent RNA helicase DHX15/PRP43
MHDKNWAWNNYLSLRALQQADSIRTQLKRIMERYDIESVTISDEKKLFSNIRQALVCGFFMQVAHKEGEKGNYLTVKDNQVSRPCQYLSTSQPFLTRSICQVVALHPSCGLDTQPEWVLFNEFVLTTRPYIRTVSEIKAEWYVLPSRLFSSTLTGYLR